MLEEKVFNMIFIDATFNGEHAKMISELEETHGVHGVTPEIDQEGKFRGISVRVDKNMDLCDVLDVIMKRGLRIRMINTKEPTLEDAFMAITRRRGEQPDGPRDFGRGA